MNTIKFGIPDSLLKINDADIPCTDEGEAMALACGAWFAGKKPVVYMQNSGLGNCVDIITSLYNPYGIPLPLMILGLRYNPRQHRFMGKITRKLIDLLEYDQDKITFIKEILPYGAIDPYLRVGIADDVLDEILQITRQLKIRACLTHGLCLGFIRDGGYIEDGNDLDIGVICDEEKKARLFESLKKNGFNQGDSWYSSVHFYKNKILVDIHFLETSEFYLKFGSVQYKGKAYPVPSPIKKYLIALYSNWRIKE